MKHPIGADDRMGNMLDPKHIRHRRKGAQVDIRACYDLKMGMLGRKSCVPCMP